MRSYFVFNEWRDWDTGGMDSHHFETKEDLLKFLESEVENMPEDQAREYLMNVTIIEGKKITPKIKEIVTKVAMDI